MGVLWLFRWLLNNLDLILSFRNRIRFLNGKNENLIETMLLKLNPQELSVLICFKNLKQNGKINPDAESFLIYGGNSSKKEAILLFLGLIT